MKHMVALLSGSYFISALISRMKMKISIPFVKLAQFLIFKPQRPTTSNLRAVSGSYNS